MKARRSCQLTWGRGRTLDLGRRTRVMGILNVTPDSFSDGGRHAGVHDACEHATRMLSEGADIIDIGGESTRPNALSITPEEELERVLPVIESIRRMHPESILSIDTRKATVASAALDAGADWINDVSAAADPQMAPVAAERGTPIVLMHMRGTPASMQADTDYGDIMESIVSFLEDRKRKMQTAGLSSDKILLDPGIGFGKSTEGNFAILRNLSRLAAIGCPLLVGASRKRFLGEIHETPVDDRLEASLAAATIAVGQGAHIVRVHDVRETVRVVRLADAVRAD